MLVGLTVTVSAFAKGYTTALSGANEISGAGVPGAGDPDGAGTATITLNQGKSQVCWSITVAAITLPATAAHIHVAPAGVVGPVVVGLSAPGADGTSSGCITASAELIKDIKKNPANYYVNVHNVDYPAGAVRGQLG